MIFNPSPLSVGRGDTNSEGDIMRNKLITVIGVIILGVYWGVASVFACEAPIKAKDHVSPSLMYIVNDKGKLIESNWHCGDVKSVSGECGRWIASITTCRGDQIKCFLSYLRVLNTKE